MIPSSQYVRAYRKSCPNVRFDQDEALELGRLFHEAQKEGESTTRTIILILNEASVTDYENMPISTVNVLQGIRRLLGQSDPAAIMKVLSHRDLKTTTRRGA